MMTDQMGHEMHRLTAELYPICRSITGNGFRETLKVLSRHVPRAGISQRAATKSALKAFTDSLLTEVNPAGVRVLSMFVGRTATPMQAAIHKAEGKEYRPGAIAATRRCRRGGHQRASFATHRRGHRHRYSSDAKAVESAVDIPIQSPLVSITLGRPEMAARGVNVAPAECRLQRGGTH